jgi:hypothetical protein
VFQSPNRYSVHTTDTMTVTSHGYVTSHRHGLHFSFMYTFWISKIIRYYTLYILYHNFIKFCYFIFVARFFHFSCSCVLLTFAFCLPKVHSEKLWGKRSLLKIYNIDLQVLSASRRLRCIRMKIYCHFSAKNWEGSILRISI